MRPPLQRVVWRQEFEALSRAHVVGIAGEVQTTSDVALGSRALAIGLRDDRESPATLGISRQVARFRLTPRVRAGGRPLRDSLA